MSVCQVNTLSVSIVVYFPDVPILERTFASLIDAVLHARLEGVLSDVRLDIIDNTSVEAAPIDVSMFDVLQDFEVYLKHGHGNVGYGRGHNLGINETKSQVHLVLNPDVFLEQDSLVVGLQYLNKHHDVGLVAPRSFDENGNEQFLCRRYPTVLVLLFRGFLPNFNSAFIRKKLFYYEMRDVINDSVNSIDVPIASGCCMLFRTDSLKKAGGFSDDFFMYFEDYDLSLRIGEFNRVLYLGSMRIVHLGGGASRKGLGHIRMFAKSAFSFFRKHGLKWF
ncbi:glycosyltransferase family 2 protein [Mariprofundus sp. KV]|uniref:glycosyltransferase n=1 Tax=Mariprofundus sp. KV TaxID=2608715 RepID=UPI0015A0F68D|nr:glycosyltransferase family 2 protein [Mariprofundus sp. KV]NWF36782.1 glycosyltransferase family 2 protein [Mariprofundus sp. KV]